MGAPCGLLAVRHAAGRLGGHPRPPHRHWPWSCWHGRALVPVSECVVVAMFEQRDERSDAELLAATGEGDRTALAALYVRHAPWLLVRLSRRCSDRSLVDEVVQDTFVGVWRGARRWSGRGEVGAWIWGIGVRRLLDRLRRRPPALFALGSYDELVISAEEEVLLGVQFGDL